ncbi:MAG: hypothetical protein HY900_16885 [Deltaproteobacteria bacterium]|nr:hypothetical protein [Deltaproteobacteria bacterium]
MRRRTSTSAAERGLAMATGPSLAGPRRLLWALGLVVVGLAVYFGLARGEWRSVLSNGALL